MTKNKTTSETSGAMKQPVPLSGGNLLRPGGGGKRFLPRVPLIEADFDFDAKYGRINQELI